MAGSEVSGRYFLALGVYLFALGSGLGAAGVEVATAGGIDGGGEIAISDHRSSQPHIDELKRLAADIRVGGILSGKAVVLNIHVGDGPSGLQMLRDIVATTEIPYAQFLPTHINRSERLFEEGIDYAKAGGFIDFTCSDPEYQEAGDILASAALKRCLDRGVPPQRITFTSDGQGSLPIFNERKECVRMGVGQVSAMFAAVRAAVREEGLSLEQALPVITRNPAEIYKLKGKGRIEPGFDADVVLVDRDTLAIDTVIAKGRTMMSGKHVLVAGTFEA